MSIHQPAAFPFLCFAARPCRALAIGMLVARAAGARLVILVLAPIGYGS